MMKKYIIALAAVAGLTAAGCSDNSGMPDEGATAFGTLSTAALTLEVSDEDGTMSRGDDEATGVDTSEFIIEIKDNNKDSIVVKCQYYELPEAIELLEGEYTIDVYSSDKIADASTTPYFKGAKSFTIYKNKITEVSVTCKLVVTKVTVKLSETLAAIVSKDCKAVVTLTYTDNDNNNKNASVTLDLSSINGAWPAGYFNAKAGDTLSVKLYCNINGEKIELDGEPIDVDEMKRHTFEFTVKTSEGKK